MLDILEELENKKAGRKVGEEKKSGRKVEGEVDEKKVSSTGIRGRKKGSGRCCPQVAHVLILELDSLRVCFDSFSGRTGKEAEMEGRGQGRQRSSAGGETFEARRVSKTQAHRARVEARYRRRETGWRDGHEQGSSTYRTAAGFAK